MFSDKVLMITGGSGSFGNAVLTRFLKTDAREIRIFSRDEKKQEDMRIALQNKKVKFFIGDVRDYDSVHSAMSGVDLVFHAAALKQVPSCEFFPMEAVRTNVLGADNVVSAAIDRQVERVVVLSTDKAVYPINAMGMSKALMEKIAIAKSRGLTEKDTVISCTRYGNVMASRGSVIPLFIEQLKRNQDLTITDPSMTRFLMSLEQSVELVLYAYKNAQQGDIFVQKSPAATIADLAQALLELFPKSKSKLQIIGVRHGEKPHECLVSREEMVRAESLDNYYRIRADSRDLNYKQYFTAGDVGVSSMSDYTSENTQRLSVEEVKALLLTLEYVRSEVEAAA